MRTSIFSEGGPHKIMRTGLNQYTMDITIPPDEDGRIARECPDDSCSPGYFKVKPGTGITEGQTEAHCPYCHHGDDPKKFYTKEQVRFAKDIATREAHKGISKIIEDSLGLGPSRKKQIGGGFLSIEMSYKPGSLPHVRHPFEEELKRDIICPHCGLDHSVYGLATWCSDCGKDIFLSHVEEEYIAVKKMLTDVNSREQKLGVRVAARDIENALEDVVSIFEAVLRAEMIRFLKQKGAVTDEIETTLKRIGNSFQSVTRAVEHYQKEIGIDLFEGQSANRVERLRQAFEKRHPITHNLGIVDKKYLERVRTGEFEGRDIRVTVKEIEEAIDISFQVLSSLHRRLFDGAAN